MAISDILLDPLTCTWSLAVCSTAFTILGWFAKLADVLLRLPDGERTIGAYNKPTVRWSYLILELQHHLSIFVSL